MGPQLDAFEAAFRTLVGTQHVLAVNSGTAALHLALRQSGVGPGDEVLCSTLTFVAHTVRKYIKFGNDILE